MSYKFLFFCCSETYGPFTRCYDHPSWNTLSLEDRAKLMARQGQAFATAQDVRVVLPPKDENDQVLVDVPKDGKTVGEIMTRGNIVMKEVSYGLNCGMGALVLILCSISAIQRLRKKLFEEGTSVLEIWLLCNRMASWLSWTGVRILLSPEER